MKGLVIFQEPSFSSLDVDDLCIVIVLYFYSSWKWDLRMSFKDADIILLLKVQFEIHYMLSWTVPLILKSKALDFLCTDETEENSVSTKTLRIICVCQN